MKDAGCAWREPLPVRKQGIKEFDKPLSETDQESVCRQVQRCLISSSSPVRLKIPLTQIASDLSNLLGKRICPFPLISIDMFSASTMVSLRPLMR